MVKEGIGRARVRRSIGVVAVFVVAKAVTVRVPEAACRGRRRVAGEDPQQQGQRVSRGATEE